MGKDEKVVEKTKKVEKEAVKPVEKEVVKPVKEEAVKPVEKPEKKAEPKKAGYVCLKCGEELKKDQEFCPICGTKKGNKNNKLCEKCGTVIEEGQKFCPKCGNKAKLSIQSDIVSKTKNINKPLLFGIIGLVVILLLGGCVATKLLPKIFVSTEELLAEGNYREAYDKAKKEEKQDILDENMMAVISNLAVEGLKDPESFILRNAWYDKSAKRVVLEVSGNNSYGAKVTGYWYFTYNKDDEKYVLYTSLSSLTEEKTYSFDDYKERIEKILKNAARKVVKNMINDDSIKIKKESIDNINNLFEKGILDDVEILEENKEANSEGEKV